VAPSPDSPTLVPKELLPFSSDGVSFACCVHVPPERAKVQAVPWPELSFGAPIRAIVPSPESETLVPNAPEFVSPLPVSFACCVQVPPERWKIQAAPTPLESSGPPISAVLPSAESETLKPNCVSNEASLGASLPPCWTQAPPERT
jgi:hypothetical protein